MDTKSLRVEIKDADRGEVAAIFSTFDVVDSDRDVTKAGAFEDGAEMAISAYGHTSWSGALPVGKGRIRTTAKEAILEGQFFLDTVAGRDTFTVVKELGPLGQWSYGFDVTEESYGEHEGQRVRFLKGLKVHEVSPVLLGAGVNTRTLVAKHGKPGGHPRGGQPIPVHECEVVTSPWDGAKAVAEIGRPSELRAVHAWVDPDGDPEAKSSYRLAHHHGADGPANVRTCLAGIAALNGKASDIPDVDRQAVYEHLAAHLRDAGRDVPELRSQPGVLKFNEELVEGMGMLSGLLDSASRVVALRAEKGKELSNVNAEILGWIDDDLRRLKALLSDPESPLDPSDAELASVIARSVAQINGL